MILGKPFNKIGGEMPKPVILCIGTTNIIGDSLGPKVGDKLIMDENINAYVYGFSSRPVNGNNYDEYIKHIRMNHKNSILIAIDACLGRQTDIGKIKYSSTGLKAGSALNKGLKKIGDIGILGIVAKANNDNFNTLKQVNVKVIEALSYKIVENIKNIIVFLNNISKNEEIKNISK